MQWPKAKNILILFLLAVNLCLLVVFLAAKAENKTLDDTFISSSVKALEQRGLTVKEKVIPKEYLTTDTVLYSFNYDDYSALTAAFSGKQTESDLFKEDGSLAGIYFRGQDGEAKIYFNGRFTFTAPDESVNKQSVAKAKDLALLFAQLSGLPAQNFAVLSATESENGYTVEIGQKLNSILLKDYGITVQTDGTSVFYAEGQLMLSKTTSSIENAGATSIDALFALAKEEVACEVSEIVPCYYPLKNGKNSRFAYSLIPAFCFETDNGTFYYLISSRKIVQ